MLYNIIPLILILGSAIIIIFIIVKKFPAVVSLDVNSIPQEKERQVKQQIINNRLKRNLKRWQAPFIRAFRPLANIMVKYVKSLYQRLLSLSEHYARASRVAKGSISEIDEFFLAAEDYTRNQNYNEAEKCYIKIISLDSKNIEAFKLLGQLYMEMGKVEEAKATLAHVLKLTQDDSAVFDDLAALAKEDGKLDQSKKYYLRSLELNNDNAKTYYNLAEINQSTQNYKEAMKLLKQALNIEPKNPRYLDAIFNLSILTEDKGEALDAYKMLKDINPENAKLGEMKKQIDNL